MLTPFRGTRECRRRVTELTHLFDEGEFEMGGEIYRPRLAFVDDARNTLPGIAELTTMHDLALEPFNLAPEAKTTLEDPDFNE